MCEHLYTCINVSRSLYIHNAYIYATRYRDKQYISTSDIDIDVVVDMNIDVDINGINIYMCV